MCLVFLSIVSASNLNSSIIYTIFNGFVLFALILNIGLIIIKHPLQRILLPLFIIILYLFLLLLGIKIASPILILVYLMFYNSDLINSHLFVKCNLWVPVVSFIMIVTLNLFGKIPSIKSTLPGVTKGYTLGFTHPDSTGVMIIEIITSLFILSDYSIIHNHSHTILIVTTILSIILSLIFYPLTQCKELLYFEIIVIIFLLCYKWRRLMSIITFPLSLIIPIASIYLNYEYNPIKNIYNKINDLFSDRLNMQHIVLSNYPIHWLQHNNEIPDLTDLSIDKGSDILIDNSYVNILELFGIFGMIIAAYILFKILILTIRFKRYIPYFLVLTIIICSIVQSSLFSINLDGPLLYCGVLFSHKIYTN